MGSPVYLDFELGARPLTGDEHVGETEYFSLVITYFYQLADGALVDTYRVVILNIVSDNIDIG